MAYVLKIKYEENLRRLTLQRYEIKSESFSFAHLETRIRDLFQLPATSPLAITYTDEEDDVVTMGNDEDLRDALVEQELNPLRIYVTLSKPKSGDKAETGRAVEFDNADKVLKRLLRTFSQTSETAKNALQVYEPLLEGMKASAQIPGVFEKVLQNIAAQVSAGVKNGSAAAFGVPYSPPTPSGAFAFPPNPENCQGPQPGDSAVGTGSASVPEGVNSENQVTVHHGVSCDECGVSPIVGNRWKSMVKNDYDLCPDCYEKHGNDKEYFKIEQAKFRPRHMMHGPHRVGYPFHRRGPRPTDALPSFPMGPPFLHPTGPHGHFHGGRSFGMRGPFGGFGGRHHCGPPFADKLYARFVCDVTVFDGTEVAPETHFVKIWRLRNSGTAPWPVNTSLVFVGGDELGHVVSVPLEIPEQGLAPEVEMEASVDMVAPEKPGRYVSHWRLASPAGPKFGQRLSVVIQVVPKTSLDNAAELVFVGHDASAQEVESAAGTTSQTPAELADERKVTVKEAGPLTMMSFLNAEKNSCVPDVTEPEKEQLLEKDVPSAAAGGDFEGGLVSMGGDVEMNAAKEAAGMTEVGKNVASVALAAEELEVGVEEKKAVESKISEVSPPTTEVGKNVVSVVLAADELGVGVEEKKAVEPKISEVPPASVGSITYPVLDVTKDKGPITYPVVDTAVVGAAVEGEDLSIAKALPGKLEAMGFTDSKLNYELLEKNGFDLRKTLDDLCAAEEWDPILEELEEMGFYDTVMNRRVMFKNNGSVKRVVKELVQLYRDMQGKREKVE